MIRSKVLSGGSPCVINDIFLCLGEVEPSFGVGVSEDTRSLTFHEVSLLTILYPEGFDCVTGRSDMV